MKFNTGGTKKSALLRLEGTALGLGLAVAVLRWAFAVTTWHDFALDLFFSLIYSNCIGIPVWLSAPALYCRTAGWGWLWKWTTRASVIGTLAVLGCLLSGWFVRLVIGPHYQYWPNFESALRISVVATGSAVALFEFAETLRAKLAVTELRLKERELERERALKMATTAQLASLESRLHPHFLFNALNSATSLVHEDPDRAERLLTQIAALLRFSLDSAHTGLIPLERELKIVRDYLEIESARFESRLRYTIEVPEGLLALPVPPLSIQTLVENSVKYAVNARAAGACIQVAGRLTNAGLQLEVVDDGDPFDAVGDVSRLKPDLLFTDIEMPGLNGFEAVAKLDPQPSIVFTTAYSQYALQAFEVNSIDYLMKPIDEKQLERAIGKAERIQRGLERKLPIESVFQQLAAALPRKQSFPGRLASKLGDRIEFVDLAKVTHLYASDKLTYASTPKKDYVLDHTITELEAMLDPAKFVRIHRSTIVNINFIKELHAWFSERMVARIDDGKNTELTVSRERVKVLKEKLGL